MAKTYTAAGSATAGDVYTSSAHNVIVTDVNNLIVPASAKVSGGSQSINNATNTYLTFGLGAEWDTDSMYSAGANSRLTITTPGIYTVSAHVAFANGTTGFRYVALVKNNTNIYVMADLLTNTTSDPWELSLTNQFLYVNGDYIQIRVYHTQGSALNVTACQLAATWIGRTS